MNCNFSLNNAMNRKIYIFFKRICKVLTLSFSYFGITLESFSAGLSPIKMGKSDVVRPVCASKVGVRPAANAAAWVNPAKFGILSQRRHVINKTTWVCLLETKLCRYAIPTIIWIRQWKQSISSHDMMDYWVLKCWIIKKSPDRRSICAKHGYQIDQSKNKPLTVQNFNIYNK